MKEVLETTQFVVQESQQVWIDKKALDSFASEVPKELKKIPHWDCHYHFCGDVETTVSYLLVLDTLNFCFWPLPGERRWEVEWKSEKVSGYYGLAAALKRAFMSHSPPSPMTDPDHLENMTVETLKNALGGQGSLPLLEKRVNNLNELGHVLRTVYGGKSVHLVEAAGKSAATLARLLARDLTSYRDVAFYKNKKIFFYKRAQIFGSDLYGAFKGRGWGNFTDIHRLTAFADYKLPQVLRHVGVLKYSSELSKRVDNIDLIEEGSPEEVEIRSNTIWAVEQIRQGLVKRGTTLNASQIDWLLWSMGQKDQYRIKPYHRTRTIFY